MSKKQTAKDRTAALNHFRELMVAFRAVPAESDSHKRTPHNTCSVEHARTVYREHTIIFGSYHLRVQYHTTTPGDWVYCNWIGGTPDFFKKEREAFSPLFAARCNCLGAKATESVKLLEKQLNEFNLKTPGANCLKHDEPLPPTRCWDCNIIVTDELEVRRKECLHCFRFTDGPYNEEPPTEEHPDD